MNPILKALRSVVYEGDTAAERLVILRCWRNFALLMLLIHWVRFLCKLSCIAILLLCTSAQALIINTNTTTTIATNTLTTISNTYIEPDLYWDMESDDLQGLGAVPLDSYDFSSHLTNSPAYAGSKSLAIAPVGFSVVHFFNNKNERKWATTRRGSCEFYLYYSTYSDGRLIYQISGKTKIGALDPYDGNDGVGIFMADSAGSPGLRATVSYDDAATSAQTPNLRVLGFTSNTWYRVRQDWNGDARQTVYLQVDDNPPTYTTNFIGNTKSAEWHSFIPGNDTPTGVKFFLDEFKIFNTWNFTFGVNAMWQDFEFDTISQANLEANDHTTNPNRAWRLVGTTARFSISASAQLTSPSTINKMADTGTRGLLFDLNSTAAASLQCSNNVVAAAGFVGGWVTVPTLTTGVVARIAFVADTDVGQDELVRFVAKNTAGVYTFHITGTAESSGITFTPGERYFLSSRVIQNGVSNLTVYSSTGAEVGSVTATANNQPFGFLGLGSMSATTAQTGSIAYDNWVICNIGAIPFKPWQ